MGVVWVVCGGGGGVGRVRVRGSGGDNVIHRETPRDTTRWIRWIHSLLCINGDIEELDVLDVWLFCSARDVAFVWMECWPIIRTLLGREIFHHEWKADPLTYMYLFIHAMYMIYSACTYCLSRSFVRSFIRSFVGFNISLSPPHTIHISLLPSTSQFPAPLRISESLLALHEHARTVRNDQHARIARKRHTACIVRARLEPHRRHAEFLRARQGRQRRGRRRDETEGGLRRGGRERRERRDRGVCLIVGRDVGCARVDSGDGELVRDVPGEDCGVLDGEEEPGGGG